MKAANIINRQQTRSATNSATVSRLANMMGSIIKIIDKIPVLGKPAATVGEVLLKSAQASDATENQLKRVAKKSTDVKAGKLAGKLSNSATGATLRTLGVATGQNLSE
jgi:hypothetical protein